MDEVAVVTAFLRNGGEILLLKRSDAVGSYAGLWGGVAGHAEGDPDTAVREEIREETGLLDQAEVVRSGDPFVVPDEELGTRWRVHPYLFDCADRGVLPNEETSEVEWVPATTMLRRETVPDLWESYRRVRPTVESVASDREHGAAYLSIRALEILRDTAGAIAEDVDPGTWSDLAALAAALLEARPNMVVIRTRLDRAMARAAPDRTPAAVERAAVTGIDHAVRADEAAATETAARLEGRVLTLSRSGTVRAALARADIDEVVVAQSLPGAEGVAVAESLASDVPVTLIPDTSIAQGLAELDVTTAVVGADSVLPDGTVVNKVGTRGLAIAAAREEVPVLVGAARDKIAGGATPNLEALDADEIYHGSADVSVWGTRFDLTPPDLVTVLTEDGEVPAAEIASIAADHRRLRDWRT